MTSTSTRRVHTVPSVMRAAANPYIAFELVAQASGRLDFSWEGDAGFVHTESAMLRVA